ncbi:MAG TPA: AMP-binding protein [Rhizobiaceae bacterium]|nr:AMP-binding protein [Rhizobiaceae bacterium]
MNVADQIRRAVRRFAGLPAVISGDETRSFAEIDERSDRLANALLALGLRKGDRVATLLENSVRCVEVDFALAKAGLVRVSLNPRSTAKDAGVILEDSDATAFIFGDGYSEIVTAVQPEAKHVRHWLHADEGEGPLAKLPFVLDYEEMLSSASSAPVPENCHPEDLYCLFYTSGTTGRPKGVMLSHRSILQISFNLLMEVGPQQAGEKVLLMQPMSHGAGFFVLPWFMRGGVSVIMRHFDAEEVLRLSHELEIETIKLVPTMLQRMLRVDVDKSPDLPKLRQIIYGASAMPAEALRKAITRFGSKFVQIYGQSEAAVTLSVLPLSEHDPDGEHPERLMSAGVPFPSVEMKILDTQGNPVGPNEPGEVVLRAPQLMSGYWKLPELTSQTIRDGWLHTKDLGRIDEHGFLYLLGRMDEMIISGGYNIAPREIEEALYRHPAIQEAAVVGEPDEEWGNAVVAYVALRNRVGESEIIDFARTELGFKRPKRIYRVPELPKNANGKIQKSALNPQLAMLWEPIPE